MMLCGEVDATSAPGALLQRFPLLGMLWSLGSSLLGALLVVLRARESWVIYGATTVFLMYLTCIGIGTACFRVAFRKAGKG